MKIAYLLIIGLLVFGCESTQTKPVTPAIQPKASKPVIVKPIIRPIEGVYFSGGDGSSVETAVIIKAPNNYVGVRGEFDWIKRNCPGWKLDKQSVLKGGGKVYDKMYFITPEGRSTNLFFDVTDFYGKK